MDRSHQAALRAILFTDIVGSTELRSRLGDDRADGLRRVHNAMLGSAVTAHSGRVLRWTGDGMKADFATASAAVAAAIDMQRAVAAYGQGPDPIAAFQIRIGISVGEVVVEGTEAHGIAAIEAARLEPLASPGQILATSLVQHLGQRRGDAEFEAVGSYTLKGLDHPVDVIRVVDNAADAASRPLPRSLHLDRRFPLVGRADEVALALEGWDAVQAGSPATVLVVGQPGLGKSRLAAQVADRAHGAGALVLAGACDSDLAVPYQPFATALSEIAAQDDELAAAVADGAGPLGPLFPARRTDRSDDPGPAARFELFEAVAALLARLAEDQPVVLVLEDLQWAAAATVQLLRHLVRTSPPARVLLLGTCRAEELDGSGPLQDMLADQQVAAAITRVELRALLRDDVAELVAARVPFAPDDNMAAFVGRVYDESAGSPFFVCELLDHLSATGELEQLVDEGGGDQLPIPDSVREVVGQRLGRLDDGTGKLLSTAAVVGFTFDLDLLAALSGSDEERVLEQCEDLSRGALITEADAGQFSFAHAIVRSTVLERLSATRLSLAHRKVAEAIEALGRADDDQLERHWRLAGVEDKANASLERAARRDLEALAYESAVERYQVLLDYHQGPAGGGPAALARAWLGLGMARRALAQPEYVSDVEEAGRLGRKLRDPDIVADAAVASIWPGTFFMTAGRTQRHLVELGEAALDLIDVDDPRRPRILSTVASHLTFDGDRQRRVDLIDEAHRLARANGDPELIGSVLVAEFLTLWDPTTFTRRAEIAKEVARMARSSGDNELEFFAGFFATIGAVERGQVAEARERLERLEGPAKASRNFYYEFLIDRLGVSLDIFTGEPELQPRVDALAARYDDTHADTAGTWSLQTGFLAVQAGTFGSLVPTLRTMVEESDITTWLAAYGLSLLAAGDTAAAGEVLDQLEDPPLDYLWIASRQVTAELAVGLGRQATAAHIYEQLLPFREHLAITASGSLCYGLVATTLGTLALATDRAAEAEELLDEAVQRSDAMGAPFEAVKSRRLLASARLVLGQPWESVTPLVRTAADQAAEYGFHGEQALLVELATGR